MMIMSTTKHHHHHHRHHLGFETPMDSTQYDRPFVPKCTNDHNMTVESQIRQRNQFSILLNVNSDMDDLSLTPTTEGSNHSFGIAQETRWMYHPESEQHEFPSDNNPARSKNDEQKKFFTSKTTEPQAARSRSKQRTRPSSKESLRSQSSEGRSPKEQTTREIRTRSRSNCHDGKQQRTNTRHDRRRSSSVVEKASRSSSKYLRPPTRSNSKERVESSSMAEKRTDKRTIALSRSAGDSVKLEPKDAEKLRRSTSHEGCSSRSRTMVENAAEATSIRRLSGNATLSTTEELTMSPIRRHTPRSSSQRRNTQSAESVPSAEVVAMPDIRRATSLSTIPSPSRVSEGSPSIRRMRKGSMNAILSPRVGRRKSISSNWTSSSCRNLSQSNLVESGTRKSSSVRKLRTESANTQLEPTLPPKSVSASSATTSTTSQDSYCEVKLNDSIESLSQPKKPESENSATSWSHGTMPLKEPSGPDDPPPKRPQRVRRGYIRAAATPSLPSSLLPPAQHLSKPSSSRFLEFSADAPPMGLSVPRRSHSPGTAQRK